MFNSSVEKSVILVRWRSKRTMSAPSFCCGGRALMGSGIAQLAAMNGYSVRLCDRSRDQLHRAEQEIEAGLGKLVRSGRLEPGAADTARGAVGVGRSVVEAATGAGVVVEAVVELLDVKQEVLAEAATVARPDAILATDGPRLLDRVGLARPWVWTASELSAFTSSIRLSSCASWRSSEGCKRATRQ